MARDSEAPPKREGSSCETCSGETTTGDKDERKGQIKPKVKNKEDHGKFLFPDRSNRSTRRTEDQPGKTADSAAGAVLVFTAPVRI